MSYTYNVLTEEQVRLLSKYSAWADKIDLPQLLDECLTVATLGEFSGDVTIGRDLFVTRNCVIGGGYGTTGWTCDTYGNTHQDGLADFEVGGISVPNDTPAAADPGYRGMVTWGVDGGQGYVYVCFGAGDWRRAQLTAGY